MRKVMMFITSLMIGGCSPAMAYHNFFFRSADDIISGTLSDSRLSVNVTTQSNTFNGANQLVRLNSSGALNDGIGSDNTMITTFTKTMRGGGDVALATSPFTAVAGAVWANERDTFTIASISCYTFNPSTVAATIFNVVRSTEIGATAINGVTVHSSSFTVAVNTKFSPWATPDNITVINANETLALWITSVAGSGDPASEFGCRLRGWYKRQ